MRATKYLLVGVGVFVLGVVAILVSSVIRPERWVVDGEPVSVGSPTREAKSISFFVTVSNQVSDSVLQARPIHYLRPFELHEWSEDEWVVVPTVRKLTRGDFGSRDGLRRSFFQYACTVSGGTYRALLIYRYRSRWDHLRLRVARRLPGGLGRWILPNRADGAVWTESFYLEPDPPAQDEQDRGTIQTESDTVLNPISNETFLEGEASSIRVRESQSN